MMEMTPQECCCCHVAGPRRLNLVHEPTGESLQVCWRCLRSSIRAKADARDARGAIVLGDYAAEYGWRVWRAGEVLYLLPSLTPMEQPPSMPVGAR